MIWATKQMTTIQTIHFILGIDKQRMSDFSRNGKRYTWLRSISYERCNAIQVTSHTSSTFNLPNKKKQIFDRQLTRDSCNPKEKSKMRRRELFVMLLICFERIGLLLYGSNCCCRCISFTWLRLLIWLLGPSTRSAFDLNDWGFGFYYHDYVTMIWYRMYQSIMPRKLEWQNSNGKGKKI